MTVDDSPVKVKSRSVKRRIESDSEEEDVTPVTKAVTKAVSVSYM